MLEILLVLRPGLLLMPSRRRHVDCTHCGLPAEEPDVTTFALKVNGRYLGKATIALCADCATDTTVGINVSVAPDRENISIQAYRLTAHDLRLLETKGRKDKKK
jgi:hypothetical protein